MKVQTLLGIIDYNMEFNLQMIVIKIFEVSTIYGAI